MKSEFVVGKSQVGIHRWLRRINARLVRLVPKTYRDERGLVEAYHVFYVEEPSHGLDRGGVLSRGLLR